LDEQLLKRKNENRTYPDIDGTITGRISKQQKKKRHIAKEITVTDTGRISKQQKGNDILPKEPQLGIWEGHPDNKRKSQKSETTPGIQ
jgi:hypothetical protein